MGAYFPGYKDRSTPYAAGFATALALFWNHFGNWQNDPDSGPSRPGNRTIYLGLPSGATATPKVTVERMPLKIPHARCLPDVGDGGARPIRADELALCISVHTGPAVNPEMF
jgi:hypothetical protein